MTHNRQLSQESLFRGETEDGIRSPAHRSFASRSSRASTSTHDNFEMSGMHVAPGRIPAGETDSALHLLDNDGPDLSLRNPLDNFTENHHRKSAIRPKNSWFGNIAMTLSSWWWWEICGCLVCILSTTLLVAFAAQIDQMPRQEWSYRLQPNTVVSIIATSGKISMMVPIAACISQLKWKEFKQPTRLSLLQGIDDASRGPWGSLVLMSKGRTKVLLIPALAFLTVAAVGFEPSAQQILDFPTRTALLRNASAEIGIATEYSSAVVASNEQKRLNPGIAIGIPYAKAFVVNSIIITSVLQKPTNQSPRCPGYVCSWEAFSTLDVCGSYENITTQVRPNCTLEHERTSFDMDGNKKTVPPRKICTYTFPGRNRNGGTFEYEMDSSKEGANLLFVDEATISRRSGIILNIIKLDNVTKFDLDTPTHFEGFTIKWYWCAKTFHNFSSSPGQAGTGKMSSEPLQFVSQHRLDDPSHSYTDPYLIVWNTSSSNALYKTKSPPFWDDLADWFDNAQLSWGSPPLAIPTVKDAGQMLYTVDMAEMVENVASALSSLVRNQDPVENLSARTFFGEAHVTESYIHVRWQWIAIAVIEVLLMASLLVASITSVRGDPLPKASVIALLVHGLEDAGDVELPKPETSATLEKSSEAVVVQLNDNGGGRVVFVKQKM
ncbi:hypothetical protein K456DRAFT_1870328 [Colletotrichum gloeosporioides 23]|nr:hypothetical protein K456DRAFT_1870328 [Colletotrichum gloeosporioides 23]